MYLTATLIINQNTTQNHISLQCNERNLGKYYLFRKPTLMRLYFYTFQSLDSGFRNVKQFRKGIKKMCNTLWGSHHPFCGVDMSIDARGKTARLLFPVGFGDFF